MKNNTYTKSQKRRMILHLQEKEKRALRQKELHEKWHLPILTFMLNVPGVEKQSSEMEKVEKVWIKRIEEELCGKIKTESFFYSIAGNYYLAAVDMDALSLKQLALQWEEEDEIGRILDVDILDENLKSISRTDLGYPLRKCFICDQPAKICMREQNHEISELLKTVHHLIIKFNRRENNEKKN